jgi:hypothetical protein
MKPARPSAYIEPGKKTLITYQPTAELEDFDIDRFLARSRRLDFEDLAWDTVKDHPVDPQILRVLQYFMDIESHTIVYLRELLKTSAIEDPKVSGFLGCWNYEEFFHGFAIEKFLKAYGVEPDRSPGRVLQQQRKTNALWLWAQDTLGRLLGPRFIGVHMTWGAMNELTTVTAYQAILEMTDHPVLTELIQRIMRDERRHFAFYFQQARIRLADQSTRWWVTNLAKRYFDVVGTGEKPPEEVAHLVRTLFGGSEGLARVREMDRTMARLPGFSGLRILEGVRLKYVPA